MSRPAHTKYWVQIGAEKLPWTLEKVPQPHRAEGQHGLSSQVLSLLGFAGLCWPALSATLISLPKRLAWKQSQLEEM